MHIFAAGQGQAAKLIAALLYAQRRFIKPKEHFLMLHMAILMQQAICLAWQAAALPHHACQSLLPASYLPWKSACIDLLTIHFMPSLDVYR